MGANTFLCTCNNIIKGTTHSVTLLHPHLPHENTVVSNDLSVNSKHAVCVCVCVAWTICRNVEKMEKSRKDGKETESRLSDDANS